MANHGRKSAAELAVVAVAPLARPEAPGDLPERESEIWRTVVDSLPADWFSPGDLPVLRAYVTSVALHERASLECRDAELTISSVQGGMVVNPVFRVQDMAARQVASLAVKLRLAQSARYDPRKAASRSNEAGAKKLWAA